MSMTRRILGLLLSSMVLLSTAHAEDPLVDGGRWSPFEQRLKERGVHVDTPSLRQALSSNSDAAVRLWAAMVLGLRHEESARQLLHQVALTDAAEEVREQAWVALGRLGDTSARSPLEERLKRLPELADQVSLASQLAELGDPAGYSYVEKAASSKNAMTRAACLPALVEFVPIHRLNALESDPLEHIVALSRDVDVRVRSEALVYLQVAVSKGADEAEVARVFEQIAIGDPVEQIRETARQQLELLKVLWKSHRRP